MSAFFVMLILIGTVISGGILKIKMLNQHQRDAQRKTYVLNFPADLDHDRVVSWLESISHSMRRSKMTANQTMVFDIGTAHGIEHRLKIPWEREDMILPRLRALAPGISATPLTDFDDVDWTYGLEIGMKNLSFPLRIRSAKDTTASILSATEALRDGEAVLLQVIITPAPPMRKPNDHELSNKFWQRAMNIEASKDEINERRDKLSEPNVLGVVRLASKANTDARAHSLVDRIWTAYSAVNGSHNRWVHGAADRAVIERAQHAHPSPSGPATSR